MALFTFLPVYKASYDLLVEIFSLTKNFSREYKYTIGQNLKNEAVEMIINIYRANGNFETRKKKIQEARENIEVIRLLIRLLKDLKQIISTNKFIQINEKIESVSKQLVGWEKSSK